MAKPDQGFLANLESYQKDREALQWEGDFTGYLDLVKERPHLLGRFAHKYVYDAIASYGIYEGRDKLTHYKLFESGPYAIYGIDDRLASLMNDLRGASLNQEKRRRLILLVGPPGGGKSTIAIAIKRCLEAYSRTDEGALFAIQGCPQHDDPLKLIPAGLRGSFREEYGVSVEGEVCPFCQYQYADNPNWVDAVRVERIFIDEQKRVGIGTFWAGDPKSQDSADLIGSVNLVKLGEHGSASDPRAFDFNGEVNKANRGLLELGEAMRFSEEQLRWLISLATEGQVKVSRFAMLHSDTVLLGHTNLANYHERLVKPKEAEAHRRRFLINDIPLPSKVSAEIKIYEKMNAMAATKGVHISPDTLRVIATWAVLTRVKPSAKAELMTKLKLYDGVPFEAIGSSRSRVTVKELLAETPGEGMTGVPPSYVMQSLSDRLSEPGRACLNPVEALLSMIDGLDKHADTKELPEKEKKNIIDLIAEARREFEVTAQNMVQKAFVHAFSEQAQTLFDNYVDQATAFIEETTIEDPVTGELVKPDEALMRGLEEQINIPSSGAKEFRLQLLAAIGQSGRDGLINREYTKYPRLRQAIEKKLTADLIDYIKIAATSKTPDEEQKKKISEVADRLVEEGYCPHCANHLIRFAGTMLRR